MILVMVVQWAFCVQRKLRKEKKEREALERGMACPLWEAHRPVFWKPHPDLHSLG